MRPGTCGVFVAADGNGSVCGPLSARPSARSPHRCDLIVKE